MAKLQRELEVGDVLSFTVRRRHFLCQVIAVEQRGGARVRTHEVVVFAGGDGKAPRAADIGGRAIHVLRVAPKNQPLYLKIDGPPPAAFRRLGRRPAALAEAALPRTFRTSPRSGEDTLPVWATWSYAVGRLALDLAKQPAPYRSRWFPRWSAVDARALRAIDVIVSRLAETRPVSEAALRKAVLALNRHEAVIDTPGAEELSEKLIALAARGGLEEKLAATVVDRHRSW